MTSQPVSSTGETTSYAATVDPALLVEGSNLLAVEVYQSDLTSSDVSFDLSLTA